jgi:hypothetical protein
VYSGTDYQRPDALPIVQFFAVERQGMGCLWRMIFGEVQKIKGEDDADWDVDGGRRLPWIERSDSSGGS